MMELHRGRLWRQMTEEKQQTLLKHRGPEQLAVCLGFLCRSKSDQTGSRTGDHTGSEGSGRTVINRVSASRSLI